MDLASRHSLRENRLHGTDTFPIMTYYIERSPGEHVLDCHWHEEAEFFVVLEGEALFQVDTDYFPVRAGEAVFLDGGDIHAGHSLNGSSCTFCAIVFDPQLLSSSTYDLVEETAAAPLRAKTRTFPRLIKPESDWQKNLLHSLSRIIELFNSRRPGHAAAIKGLLLLMLAEIAEEGRCSNRSITGSEALKIERLKRTITFLQEHYSRPLRIRELAEQIPMSEGQFCRFFKSMTRQTPVEYLNAYRIKRAAELLSRTDRKISDIGLEVGFDHISYFIKVFQKYMKVTPSQYRQQLPQGIKTLT